MLLRTDHTIRPRYVYPVLDIQVSLTFELRLQDRARVIAQQPLEGFNIPGYLIPSKDIPIKPPVLRYGWRLGKDKLMEILTERLPEAIQWSWGPDPWGHEDNEEEWFETLPPDAFNKMWPSPSMTLLGPGPVSIELCKHLGLPTTFCDFFDVQPFSDSNDNAEFGIAIGSNYVGILNDTYYARLKAIFSPDEDAKWYLDCRDWVWTRPSKSDGESHGS